MTTLTALAPTERATHPDLGASFGQELSIPVSPPTRRLRIAFLNNMPDASFCTAERQFGRLLQSGGGNVDIQRYVLGGISRKPTLSRYIREHYNGLETLWDSESDAIVVTGANPHTTMLSQENYWRELCSVLSWGVTHTSSVVVSCLAAHAAMLHFVGIGRRRSERKLSGVFEQAVAQHGPLTRDLPASVMVPHSRKNGVSREDLEAVGFDVLIGAGQDIWTLATTEMSGCLIVALQGHPEYDAETLLLEYRRDVEHFQRGLREDHPDLPVDYLDAASVELLTRYRDHCIAARRAGGPYAAFPYGDVMWRVTSPWSQTASVLYRNWLGEVCRRSALSANRG